LTGDDAATARAALAVALASLAFPASAQQPHAGTVLAFKEQGRIEVAPDYAQFHAIVATKRRSLADAAAAHGERATRARCWRI
jgi:hypothetical protein